MTSTRAIAETTSILSTRTDILARRRRSVLAHAQMSGTVVLLID